MKNKCRSDGRGYMRDLKSRAHILRLRVQIPPAVFLNNFYKEKKMCNVTMELVDGTEWYYEGVTNFEIEYSGSLISFKYEEETYRFPASSILYFKVQ